jgi:uncharacterized cupredoxin-like copper-binding protein
VFNLSAFRARFITLALLLSLSSLLAACDTGGSATPVPPTPAAVATTATGAGSSSGAVNVTLSEFMISPATINVAAGHVTFNVTNSGKYPHNFGVMVNGTDMKTANLNPGDSATLAVDLTAGTYNTLCDIPTHKDKGMAGTIVVK